LSSFGFNYLLIISSLSLTAMFFYEISGLGLFSLEQTAAR